MDAFWRVNSDWRKYTLAQKPWDWMLVMYSMLGLTDSILVEVASLEVDVKIVEGSTFARGAS